MPKIDLTSIIKQYNLDFNSFDLTYKDRKDMSHVFYYVSKNNSIKSIKGYVEWNKANTINIYDLLINNKNAGNFTFKNPLLIEKHHVILLSVHD